MVTSNRWSALNSAREDLVTPMRLEIGRASTPVHDQVDISDEERDRGVDSRGPRMTTTVASLATVLEAAIRAGETGRALDLVEQLRATTGEPAPMRLVR
jgi:hypothetical protein